MPDIADKNVNLSRSDNVNGNNGNDRLVTITDPDVEVTLPVLQYGYRTTKATWEELVRIIQIEANLAKLSRSRAQQHDYEVFRYHMKQQYVSTLDYILISKFGFDAIPAPVVESCNGDDNNHNDKNLHAKRHPKWMAHPCLQDVKTPQKILVENDFPYCVQDNIVHYVLWKLKEPITAPEISEAREELVSQQNAREILQWVNPPNLKSIPEIDHVHLLCLL